MVMGLPHHPILTKHVITAMLRLTTKMLRNKNVRYAKDWNMVNDYASYGGYSTPKYFTEDWSPPFVFYFYFRLTHGTS